MTFSLVFLLLRLSISLGVFFFCIYAIYLVWNVTLRRELIAPHKRTWRHIFKKDQKGTEE